MRGQFAGAVLLGIVAASGAGGGYRTHAPFSSRIDRDCLRLRTRVIVRCHWCPLWQDRHYFCAVRRPKVDRRGVMPTCACRNQEFYRYWSLSSVFDPQLSPTSVPTPRKITSGFSSAAQSAASNIQSQRRRIRHVQTFDLARQVDARKVIAGCSRELTQTFSLSAKNQRQWCA
jgi:hypothetical protein